MPEVHVYLAEGRSDEQKRSIMAGITEAMVTHLGCPRDVVTVQIIESKWTEKMKGGRTFTERYAAGTPASYHAALASGSAPDAGDAGSSATDRVDA